MRDLILLRLTGMDGDGDLILLGLTGMDVGGDLILLGLTGMDGNARPNTAGTGRDGWECET